MGELLDKVKEKMKDAKDMVVDGSMPSSDNSQTERKYAQGGPDVEIISNESPVSDGYGKQESGYNAETGKKPGFVIPDATTDTNADTAVAINTHHDYNQNYRTGSQESSNPFVTGFKIWENYVMLWMDFYTRVLDNYVRAASGFIQTKRYNSNNL
jgi:hypothetical protein